MWWIPLIGFQLLDQLFIPGVNPTWSWCVILSIYHEIPFADLLTSLSRIVCNFVQKGYLSLVFLWCLWFWYQVMLVSLNELRNVLSFSILVKSLYIISIISSLNVWENPLGKPSRPGVFFVWNFSTRDAWVAQSVKCLPSAQVMISGSWDRAPCWAPCSARSLLLPLPLKNKSPVFLKALVLGIPLSLSLPPPPGVLSDSFYLPSPIFLFFVGCLHPFISAPKQLWLVRAIEFTETSNLTLNLWNLRAWSWTLPNVHHPITSFWDRTTGQLEVRHKHMP